jgi:glycosyltransferase involved in cell wall biosynthesis
MAGPVADGGVNGSPRKRLEGVTVVIPTRNRSDLLRLTLTSVLWQRDVDLHVVVVDDASTEDVQGLVAGFADPRVRVVRHDVSKGVSAARNTGLSTASTGWVAFCDDDDLWSPDKLWRQLNAAESARSHWAYAGSVYVNTDLVVQNGAPPLPPEAMTAALYRYNPMPAGASNVVAHVDILKRLGGFDARLTHVPDWDLWVRLARSGAPAWVPDPLVGYRLHAGNASFRTAEMLAEFDDFERRHGLKADRSRFHRHLAHLCLRSGRRIEAVRHFLRALMRFRDGYSRIDFAFDGRLIGELAGEIIRRRSGRPRSKWAAQRLDAARQRDPHAAWKAQAQAWLDDLPR